MSTPVGIDDHLGLQSRRPKDTAFKQQRLSAWQPILTAGTVLPAFFAIGFTFIPIGIALYFTSNSVQEISLDYTENCDIINTITVGNTTYESCKDYLEDFPHNYTTTCQCKLNFRIDAAFERQVYLYYGLTNFYQNHRRYVKSRDDKQLRGEEIPDPSQLSSDCDPYRRTEDNQAIAPCGAIANSLFNDKIDLQYHPDDNSDPVAIKLKDSDIAWNTDKNVKFANPDSWDNTAKPPYWDQPVFNLSDNPLNNGYKNEDLIVWMRTAALPTFRKLYRIVEKTDGIGLKRGNYSFLIDYKYPVTQFQGSKRVILTTTSLMGGKNPFLGIAYLVVGSICILLGVFFLIVHFRVGKKPNDMVSNVNSRTDY